MKARSAVVTRLIAHSTSRVQKNLYAVQMNSGSTASGSRIFIFGGKKRKNAYLFHLAPATPVAVSLATLMEGKRLKKNDERDDPRWIGNVRCQLLPILF